MPGLAPHAGEQARGPRYAAHLDERSNYWQQDQAVQDDGTLPTRQSQVPAQRSHRESNSPDNNTFALSGLGFHKSLYVILVMLKSAVAGKREVKLAGSQDHYT